MSTFTRSTACFVALLCWRVYAEARGDDHLKLEGLLRSSGVGSFLDAWATSNTSKPHPGPLRARKPVANRSPVLLIPPYAGVQLDLKITYRPKVKHWYCPRSTVTWIFAWLNPLLLVPGEFGCYADAMRLGLDSKGRPVSPQGVQVRPRPGFASAMQLLAKDPTNRSATMKYLAEALEDLGWERDVDLRAHLYDWRLSPLGYEAGGGSFEDLKREIEDLAEETGKRVTVISYSMGSTYFNLFSTRHTTAEWREKYLTGLVSVSGVWGGSPKAVLGILSGKWAHLEDLLNEQTMKYLAQGTPSISWLMPDSRVFNSTSIVINTAYGQSYAAEELPSVLKLAGAQQAAKVLRLLTSHGATVLSSPQLPVYCFHGSKVDTTLSVLYTTKDFSDNPTEMTGDGDGTVPIQSLSICKGWQSQQDYPVKTRAFPGVGHTDMFRTAESLEAVLDAVIELGGGGAGKQEV